MRTLLLSSDTDTTNTAGLERRNCCNTNTPTWHILLPSRNLFPLRPERNDTSCILQPSQATQHPLHASTGDRSFSSNQPQLRVWWHTAESSIGAEWGVAASAGTSSRTLLVRRPYQFLVNTKVPIITLLPGLWLPRTIPKTTHVCTQMYKADSLGNLDSQQSAVGEETTDIK